MTAYSVICFLEGAFKQLCCINITRGGNFFSRHRSTFSHRNPFIVITADYAHELPDGKKIDLSFTKVNNRSLKLHDFLPPASI